MRMRCRRFPKCGVCGTVGHVDKFCPVRELNAKQERVERVKRSDIKLGLTPALEHEIALIRKAWSEQVRA